MSKSHLAIEVAGNQVLFTAFQDNVVKQENAIELSSSNYSEIKEQLDNFILAKNIVTSSDEVTLAEASKKSSLIPSNVFSESSAEDVFKLCFGTCNGQSSIDYNRLAEYSIVNVFETQDWVKRYFVLKFPRIIIQNEGTHVIREILNSNAFYLKVTLVLHANYFQLSIVKHNQLEFYSFFDYQNHEDVLYHLLFALQQKELTDEKGSLEIVAALGCEKATINAIEKDLRRIKDLQQLTLQLPNHFITKAQFHCV